MRRHKRSTNRNSPTPKKRLRPFSTDLADREQQYTRQALGVRDWPAAEAKLRSLNAASKDETVHGLKRHVPPEQDG